MEPKIAVLKTFFLRLGDKQIDMGKDVRVVKDFERFKVHLVGQKARVTLVSFKNGERVMTERIPVRPRWRFTWFLVPKEKVQSFYEELSRGPCRSCSLMMPFCEVQMCRAVFGKQVTECFLVDGGGVETKGLNNNDGELVFKRKKRIMRETKIWTLTQPFIVRAYSPELGLDGEPVPDLPVFIRRLLA